jgi:uncharacterized membrane protein HdeD (DUF308 family)
LDWIFVVLAFVQLIAPFMPTSRLIASWFVINGGLTIFSAQRDRNQVHRPASYLAGGVLSLAIGLLLFVRPYGDPVLHWTFCAYLAVFGALMLAASGILKRHPRDEPAYP